MKKIVIKECTLHGSTEFVMRRDNIYRCRKCSSMAVIKRRRKVKEELAKYKGNKCETCGYDKCVGALEFHHMDVNVKDFTISSVTRSLNILKKEVDKCILLCSNCHREIHYEDIIKNNNFHVKQMKINILNKELIKKDIENKLKQPEIAKKHGVSLSTLKRFMNKNDICFFRRK